MDDRTLVHRLIDGLPGWLARFGACVCGLGIAAWLTGRIINDRHGWSQWLWWIPGPAPMAAALVGLLLAFVRRQGDRPHNRKRRTCVWAAGLAALCVWFAIFEHRLLHRANSNPTGLKVVHWNLAQSPMQMQASAESLVNDLIRLDGDVTVLTWPGLLGWDERLNDFLNAGRPPTWVGPMVVLSRLPIVQARQLVAVEGAFVDLVVLDAHETLGRDLAIYMTDLVSDPKRSRAEQALRVRRGLDAADAPPPDIVIGDLNVPRGSWSLTVAFPGMRHAFDIAGHGYGASFERRFPLYHLDHTLLGPNVIATRYDLIDPGASRHYAQVTWVMSTGGSR